MVLPSKTAAASNDGGRVGVGTSTMGAGVGVGTGGAPGSGVAVGVAAGAGVLVGRGVAVGSLPHAASNKLNSVTATTIIVIFPGFILFMIPPISYAPTGAN